VKPTIRKAGNRWVLTRPAFGFARSDEVTLHPSWKAARAALLAAAPAAAGASTERGHFTLGLTANGWSRRGTIRMEDTA
jgi:hypothetical protein